MNSAEEEQTADRHRELLETLADSDLDLQLVHDARELLAEGDAEVGEEP